MNTRQKAVLLVGLLVMVAMFLCPPWMATHERAYFDLGYGFLWGFPLSESEGIYGANLIVSGALYINYSRLFTQWFMLAVAMAVLYKVVGSPRPKGPDTE